MTTRYLGVLALLLAGCGSDEPRELECADSADNDADGAFDCDDPDCAAAPHCGTQPPATATGGTGTGTATGSGTGTGTGAGTGTGTGTVTGPCLDIGTMFFDQTIGWDATAGRTASFDSGNGSPTLSDLTFTFGPAGWNGDTTGPPGPDRWCFVELDITGLPDSNADPSWWLEVVVPPGTPGTTNCGQDSAPGAGDGVTLCGGHFTTPDPVSEMAALGWSTAIGGPVPAAHAGIPVTFAPYGYSADNFWGSELRGQMMPGGAYGTLGFGHRVDATMTVIGGAIGDPDQHTTQTAPDGVGGLSSGVYHHIIPVYFTL